MGCSHNSRRRRGALALCAAAIASLVALPAASSRQAQCLQNVLGETLCSRTPGGAAVRGAVGEILCAPGRCAKDSDGVRWHCSLEPGGWAQLGVAGPRCQGGCTSPTEAECERR